MHAVLGIDAAWTPRNPSGVALVVQNSGRWSLARVASSYDLFTGRKSGTLALASRPDIPALAAAAVRLAGTAIDVVTIDMPVSRAPITGRREADNAISRAFGGRGCSTHSPTPERPGALGAQITEGFRSCGYEVEAASRPGGTSPESTSHPRPLLEVYPHTALLALLGAPRRVPYKAGKSTRYWPGVPRATRIDRLLSVWARIHVALEERIAGVCSAFSHVFAEDRASSGGQLTFAGMKSTEDAMDAVICAWVGVEYLSGRAVPYGDSEAAVWTPEM